MPRRVSILLILSTLMVACVAKSEGNNRDTMTQRQKDSILAKSSIPGASNVGRAMRAADSTSAGAHRADSVAADTTER